MSELLKRQNENLTEALETAKTTESKLDDIHEMSKILVDKLADVGSVLFNVWIIFLDPEIMANALFHIPIENLTESFYLCDDKTIEKIKKALE